MRRPEDCICNCRSSDQPRYQKEGRVFGPPVGTPKNDARRLKKMGWIGVYIARQ